MTSYYNTYVNSVSFEPSSFEYQRAQSNSFHLARHIDFAESEDGDRYDNSPSNMRASKPFLSNFYQEEQRELAKPGKDDCEQSIPESTDADSEEDNFESHFDAIDELSELFDATPDCEGESRKSMPFARPSNPVVRDQQFFIPRCSAPAPIMYKAVAERKELCKTNFSCPRVHPMKNF